MVQRNVSEIQPRCFDIVTGGEAWIYSYEPESKRQSAVCVFEDEQNRLFEVEKCHNFDPLPVFARLSTAWLL